MTAIDWPEIIDALKAKGVTQPDLALACGCGQATISDIRRGNTKDPRTSLGLSLLALAQQHGIPHAAASVALPTTQPQEVRDAA